MDFKRGGQGREPLEQSISRYPRTRGRFVMHGQLYTRKADREIFYGAFHDPRWYLVGEWESFNVDEHGVLTQTNGQVRPGPPLTLEDFDWVEARLPECKDCGDLTDWDHARDCPGPPGP